MAIGEVTVQFSAQTMLVVDGISVPIVTCLDGRADLNRMTDDFIRRKMGKATTFSKERINYPRITPADFFRICGVIGESFGDNGDVIDALLAVLAGVEFIGATDSLFDW